jgi:hypothetical protein
VVNVCTVVNIEYFDDAGLLIDAVDDTIGSAPCAVTASQRAEERFTDTARAQGQGSLTEFKHCRCHRFREPFANGAARSSLEPYLIALAGHVPP